MTKQDIRQRIWLLTDGIPLKLDSMTIQIVDSDKLLVTGWTNTIHFENISRENLLLELEGLKASYAELTKSFVELTDTVRNNSLKIEFHMAFDDSGKSGIGLCNEIEGAINWHIE